MITVSGLDMAAWDALAKAAGMPLAVLLGGSTGPVPAYNSNGLWLTEVAGLGDDARALVAEGGFKGLKLRLGRDGLADDLAAIEAVRVAVGADIRLMVDFNQGLSLGDALHRCHALDGQEIYWFEEAGLPLAVWLDLRELSENALRRQAEALSVVIDHFRDYYANNVVERVLSHPGGTVAIPNYRDVPGAIPIPATLSLELGNKLGETSAANMGYRFFSDYPFPPRAFHKFDPFERDALTLLRDKKGTSVYDVSGSVLERKVRLITPIIMGAGCVNCHNQHPNSPKRNWMIGDVRGLEEFTVPQPLAANIFA